MEELDSSPYINASNTNTMHWIDFLPPSSQGPNSFVLDQLGSVEGHTSTFQSTGFRGTYTAFQAFCPIVSAI
jgi:hypothetical protein